MDLRGPEGPGRRRPGRGADREPRQVAQGDQGWFLRVLRRPRRAHHGDARHLGAREHRRRARTARQHRGRPAGPDPAGGSADAVRRPAAARPGHAGLGATRRGGRRTAAPGRQPTAGAAAGTVQSGVPRSGRGRGPQPAGVLPGDRQPAAGRRPRRPRPARDPLPGRQLHPLGAERCGPRRDRVTGTPCPRRGRSAPCRRSGRPPQGAVR